MIFYKDKRLNPFFHFHDSPSRASTQPNRGCIHKTEPLDDRIAF